MSRARVHLNVYDMYWLNDYASNLGIGVFHSGIEVYGIEYAYGGHPFAFSGVFENTPRDAEELGDNFKFRESIMIGETDFSPSDVRKMIQTMGQEYRGDRYHLINCNCNHFSSHFSKTLTGQDLPGWINRLASISGSIPFLERWIPQEWLTPIALQQTLDTRTLSPPRGANLPTSSKVNGLNSLALSLSIDEASEATEDGSSKSGFLQKTSAKNGRATTHDPVTNPNGISSTWKWLSRRNSGDLSAASTSGIRSAPQTSRSNNPSPSLTRLWNTIKGSVNNANAANDIISPAIAPPNASTSSKSNGKPPAPNK